MKNLIFVTVLTLASGSALAQAPQHHMQHGFILINNYLASHLVADGHHSRQVEISGQLTIPHADSKAEFEKRKQENAATNKSYFLFQAQKVDLPTLSPGQTLEGHIVESKLGEYEPKNVIVQHATFKIKQVRLNIENPFFKTECK